jgi:hypothetical protein
MGRRRAEIFRTIRGNLFILGLLVATALVVVRCQRVATELTPHAEKLDYIAETIRTAEYGAASTQPVFELRKRFRDKITECVKITTRTRPVHLKELPGRLDFHVDRESRPFLSVDFNTLKSVGPTGEFYITALNGIPNANIPRALVALGLLGVYSPDRPCPPPPSQDDR